MKELTPLQISIRDPLSDITRKERRLLLGVSIIGIAIVKIGLIPSKISAFGIDFTPVNQKSLVYLFAIIVIYFLIAFVIYSASDFIAWRLAFRSAIEEIIRKKIAITEDRKKTVLEFVKDIDKETRVLKLEKELEKGLEKELDKYMGDQRIVFVLSGPTSIIRALFEFLLPIIVGLYTILSLIFYKPSQTIWFY